MSHIPKLFFVSVIIWISCAFITRLTGSQNEVLLQSVLWSFALAAGVPLAGLYLYMVCADLPRIYATNKFGMQISRNDMLISVSVIAFMFIGLPLTFSLLKNDTDFSQLFLFSSGLFMLVPALWLARLLWHASMTGRMFKNGGHVDRNVSPRWFWSHVIFGVFVVLMFTTLGSVMIFSVIAS